MNGVDDPPANPTTLGNVWIGETRPPLRRPVYYLAHPLSPTPEQIADEHDHPEPRSAATHSNLMRALRWLAWLRRSFPEATFIAPWIASIMAGAALDQRPRGAGLTDDCAVVERCDGIVLVGGRISSGMARERGHAVRAWDLTRLGEEPPTFRPTIPFDEWAMEEPY